MATRELLHIGTCASLYMIQVKTLSPTGPAHSALQTALPHIGSFKRAARISCMPHVCATALQVRRLQLRLLLCTSCYIIHLQAVAILGAFSTTTALCLLLLLKSSARSACRPGVAASAAGQHRSRAPIQLLTSARHGCCHQKQGTHCLWLFSLWAALLSCCCCQHRCRLRTAPPPAADSLLRLDCLLQRAEFGLAAWFARATAVLPCYCCSAALPLDASWLPLLLTVAGCLTARCTSNPASLQLCHCCCSGAAAGKQRCCWMNAPPTADSLLQLDCLLQTFNPTSRGFTTAAVQQRCRLMPAAPAAADGRRLLDCSARRSL
jgi:hypothetical protein